MLRPGAAVCEITGVPNDPRPPSNRLGEYIRRLRRARNLSQEDLAERAGISVSTLSRIERGEVIPSFETLRELAAALGVEAEALARLAHPDEEPAPAASPSPTEPGPGQQEPARPVFARAPVTAASVGAGAQLGELARVRGWDPEAVLAADRIQAAVALRELGRAAGALDTLAARITDPYVDLVRAEVAYQRGDYEGARGFARAAVDRDPGLIDSWVLGFRATMATRDMASARRWVEALQRLFPRHPRTLRAQAQLAWEGGEVGSVRAALAQLPNEAVFARDGDDDLRRLLDAPSVVVGDGRVSVLIGVFQGQGIRTVMICWRDPSSALPRPSLSTNWRPNGQAAREALKLEPIEIEEAVAMKGVRVVGMEDPPLGEPVLVGMLELRADFEGLPDAADDAYGGLMLIDVRRALLCEPRRLWAHEIRGLPLDDWMDLPRSRGATPPISGSPQPAGALLAPSVFIAYAREDHAQVEWLDRALQEHGLQLRHDRRVLRSGDVWAERIDEEIVRSDFVVLCLSRHSLEKRGHVQVELRRILAESERRPLGAAYIIPVRLVEVDPPPVLRHIHHVDLFPDRQAGADQVARHILSHWDARTRPR